MLFTPSGLAPKEQEVVQRIERMRETLRYVKRDAKQWTGLLRRTLFARAIQGSNSIEGYNVTIDDAIAAAAGEQPLEASETSWRAVVGYRTAMTYVVSLADDEHFAYSEDLLRSLHFMMMQHDLVKHPGRWRPGAVYVRDGRSGNIVYEGPDVDQVPTLMHELVETLNLGNTAPVMVQAAMAHLNLTMIHPFSDGNGRLARCLQTLVLAREGILVPEFCSIEEYLGRNTQEYYDVLATVGRGSWQPKNASRPWIRFCLTAQFRQAQTVLRRVKEYGRVWEELEGEITRRGLPHRTMLALHDAAFGYRVRNATYRSAAEISLNLSSRDLKSLSDCELLIPRGERRGRYYVASGYLRDIRDKAREPKTVEDPFATEDTFLPGLVPPD